MIEDFTDFPNVSRRYLTRNRAISCFNIIPVRSVYESWILNFIASITIHCEKIVNDFRLLRIYTHITDIKVLCSARNFYAAVGVSFCLGWLILSLNQRIDCISSTQSGRGCSNNIPGRNTSASA